MTTQNFPAFEAIFAKRSLKINEDINVEGIHAQMDLPLNTVLCCMKGPSIFSENLFKTTKGSSYVQVGINKFIEPEAPFSLFTHSCRPNCGINTNQRLITIREIKKGEKLSWDYSTSMLERNNALSCECNSKNCRESISDFDLLPQHVQDQYLKKNIVMPFISAYMAKERLPINS